MIEALDYYKENSHNADIEEFDKKVESTNYEMAESKIKSKIAQLLQWNWSDYFVVINYSYLSYGNSVLQN